MKSKFAVAVGVLGTVLAAPSVVLAQDTYIHDRAHEAQEKADFDKAVAKADARVQQSVSNDQAQYIRNENLRPGGTGG